MDSHRRPRLTPAIADVRRAVRGLLPAEGLVLVALSGGPDSLALAAAAAFEAPRAGLRAGAVIVDHGLQPGSADVAARAAQQARELGLDPVLVRAVTVGTEGGPEAAARAARYAALEDAAAEAGATLVLLGHTLDDQAETVLLGLARGSGATSLHGMAERSGLYGRPLLGIRRATTLQFCVDSRARAVDRSRRTPTRRSRGCGCAQRCCPCSNASSAPASRRRSLARPSNCVKTATPSTTSPRRSPKNSPTSPSRASRCPFGRSHPTLPHCGSGSSGWPCDSEFHVSLSRAQTLEVARLVTDWHGQKPLDLPGVRVERQGGLLIFTATE